MSSWFWILQLALLWEMRKLSNLVRSRMKRGTELLHMPFRSFCILTTLCCCSLSYTSSRTCAHSMFMVVLIYTSWLVIQSLIFHHTPDSTRIRSRSCNVSIHALQPMPWSLRLLNQFMCLMCTGLCVLERVGVDLIISHMSDYPCGCVSLENHGRVVVSPLFFVILWV